MYRDPFRGGDNLLVMCDTYKPPKPSEAGKEIELEPLPTNTRHACAIAMEKAKDQKPWFGIEQVFDLKLLILLLRKEANAREGHGCCQPAKQVHARCFSRVEV